MIKELQDGIQELGYGSKDSVQTDSMAYYRYPAMKKPAWKWPIPAYFFTGGLAAGSYLIATIADLVGGKEDRAVSRSGRYIAMGSILISPVLLIMDLGRPRRFLNMARILKSRSPMNMGTWGLSAFGAFATLGVLSQWVEDGVIGRNNPVAKVFGWVPLSVSGILGTLAAFFVGSYTGVLLSFTNVPMWAKNHLFQEPLFLTSAVSSGLAAISTTLSVTDSETPRTRGWLKQAETATAASELALMGGALATMGAEARPLMRRPYSVPFWVGAVGLGVVLPLVMNLTGSGSTGRNERRARSIVSGVSTLAGGMIFRWVTVKAGQEEADSPVAYHEYTRK